MKPVARVMARSVSGVEVMDCLGPYGVYVYERRDGSQFMLWDARRHEDGQPRTVPVYVDDGVGGGPYQAATLVAAASEGAPDHWRKLKPGEDRVFIPMTATMARVHALKLWETDSPEERAELMARFPSMDAMLEDHASFVMELDLPDIVMVTGGLIASFENDPPPADSRYRSNSQGEPVATVAEAAAWSHRLSSAQEAINTLQRDAEVTYRCRHGRPLTFAEWQALQDRGPEYGEVARDIITVDPALRLPFMLEVVTRWVGIVMAGDPRSMYATCTRVIHTCGRSHCAQGFVPLRTAFDEATAEASHILSVAAFRKQPAMGDLLRGIRAIADGLRREGLEHPPEAFWQALTEDSVERLQAHHRHQRKQQGKN